MSFNFRHKSLWTIMFLSLFMGGCGTQFLSGEARTDHLDAIKPNGQRWLKFGINNEIWREDWMACGGKCYGGIIYEGMRKQFTTPEEDKVIYKAQSEALGRLHACMHAKGYTYFNPIIPEKKYDPIKKELTK